MKSALLMCLLVASAATAQVVEFYGGDSDGRNAVYAGNNGQLLSVWTFDDFDHAGGPITAVWGNYYFTSGGAESAYYEIRSGIARGNGGTRHASGKLTDLRFLPTGRLHFGGVELLVKGNVDVPHLPSGRYYLGIQLVQKSGRAFIFTANGRDIGPYNDPNPPPTGTPLKNGNSWLFSEFLGFNYAPSSDYLGPGTWDYSYGVEVPEPLGFGLLALAATGCRRRR